MVTDVMGRTHATAGMDTALIAVACLPAGVVAAVSRWTGMEFTRTPMAIIVLAIAAAGGGMLPDFDHGHATCAQALGPVTTIIAKIVGAMSGGHRNGTHSVVGIAFFTALSYVLTSLGRWPTAIWLGFLLAVGSAALQVRFSRSSIVVHTMICLAGSYLLGRSALAGHVPAGAITWGVFFGCASHVLLFTDILTKEGCPLGWPFSKRRFHLAELTTEHATERYIVGPAFGVIAAVMVVVLCGGWPAVVGVWHDVASAIR